MTRTALLSMALSLVAACGEGKKAAPAQPAPVSPSAAAPAAPVAPAAPFDAVGEAAASYRVAAAIAPEALKGGGKAELVVAIEMIRPDVHVQKEFPLKGTVSAGPGVRLARTSLGHADALDPAGKDRRWKIGLTAGSRKGPQAVEATIRFAICKEVEPAWCVVRNDTVSATVEVR